MNEDMDWQQKVIIALAIPVFSVLAIMAVLLCWSIISDLIR